MVDHFHGGIARQTEKLDCGTAGRRLGATPRLEYGAENGADTGFDNGNEGG